MLNIAICDDEVAYSSAIYDILDEKAKKLNIRVNFDVYESGEELLKVIEREPLKYPVIFVDIIMGKLNGIEVARKIRELKISTEIIFITSSKEFLFDAFDIGAFNYILKPIDKQRLKEQFKKLINTIIEENKKFIVHKGNEIYSLDINNIAYFEVRNRIITIEYKDGNIDFYGNLSDVEKELLEYNFIRCHRAFLVNPKYIFKISGREIILKNGTHIPMSRLKINNVKHKFLNSIK